jgi:mRNA interferase RelE/StbE
VPWRLVFTRRAERDLAALDQALRNAIRVALVRMADDPGAADITKLGGRENEWRLRVGQWRARLELDNRNGLIIVLRILPRGRAYRR